MYNVVPLRQELSNISEIPQEKPFNLWLWLGIGAAAYLLLRKEKPKRKYESSQTPADLHGLDGTLRTCDAWFETVDKRGFKTHRCFIYKPACNTKRCKIDKKIEEKEIEPWEMTSDEYMKYVFETRHFMPDPGNHEYEVARAIEHGEKVPKRVLEEYPNIKKDYNLSGYTATCRTWKKNKDGKRYCAKYAPTCNAGEEYGCRTEPAPVPGAKAKEFIPREDIVKQMAKDLAYEYNERLDGARELMRRVKKYGGIAPYGGNYLKEEYKDIPSKYKSENGIKIDELAQELGFDDERSLVNAINSAEQEYDDMKAMQGGAKIRRFKTDDFLDKAYDNLIEEHGYTFSGLGKVTNTYQDDFPFLQFRKHPNGKYRAYYSGTTDLYEIDNTPVKYEFNSPKEGYRIMLYKLKPEIEALRHKKLTPEQSSFVEPSQMTLFGLTPKQIRNLMGFVV